VLDAAVEAAQDGDTLYNTDRG